MTATDVLLAILAGGAIAIAALGLVAFLVRRATPASPPSSSNRDDVVADAMRGPGPLITVPVAEGAILADVDRARRTFRDLGPKLPSAPPIPAGVVEVHKGRRVKPRTHKPPS